MSNRILVVTQNGVDRVFRVESTGARGVAGTAATITVGTTTTGNAGTDASVTNSGTSSAAVFDFTIPRGADGADGLGAEAQVKSANFTAENDITYHVVATATVTDPSPVEGKGFTVFVRNGTATVGGTAYSRAGTLVMRTFHSGAWSNAPFYSPVSSGDITFDSVISVTGSTSVIQTSGDGANILTQGENASIFTTGASADIYTSGESANIRTLGGGYVSTSSFFIFDNSPIFLQLSAAVGTAEISFPARNGEVALKPLGPYANDAAADAAGIPVGFLYYTAAGDVKIRLT